MSRLWNRALRWLEGPPPLTAGLAVTRDTVTLATSTMRDGNPVPQALRQAALAFPLFDANSPHDAIKRLAAALMELRKDQPDGVLPVQVSLPDPAVSLQLFELDAWPARYPEREALIRWRYAKLLGLDGERLACTWQSLGVADGKHLVLASAVERQQLDTVLLACREAGLLPVMANLNAIYYFNGFQDRWAPGEDGALLIVEPASSSLLLWDAERRPRFFRARWNEASGDAEYDAILADTERQVRAYVHAAPGRRVTRVMIGGGECGALMNRLGSNPKFPCAPLDAAACFAGHSPPIAAGPANAAWLASLPR